MSHIHAAGAPERLCVLMEGESLFNDSSSIVLFKIFFDMVKRLAQGRPGSQLGMGAEVLSIAGNILWLSFGQSNGLMQSCDGCLHPAYEAYGLPVREW